MHASIHLATWRDIKKRVLTDCPGSYAAHVVLQRLVQLGENKIHPSSRHFSPGLFLCAFPRSSVLLSVFFTVLLSSVCEKQRGCVCACHPTLSLSLSLRRTVVTHSGFPQSLLMLLYRSPSLCRWHAHTNADTNTLSYMERQTQSCRNMDVHTRKGRAAEVSSVLLFP